MEEQSELKKATDENGGSGLELTGMFELLEVGCTGTVEVIPGVSGQDQTQTGLTPLTTLPCGLPPLFPTDATTELEEYLTNPAKLPIHDFYKTQRFWPRERDPDSLFLATPCPVQTTLKVERDQRTGELKGYKEVSAQDTGSTARNSLSLQRQPGSLSDSVKGSSVNYPFLPGGMDSSGNDRKPNLIFDGEPDFTKDLLDVPPGFKYAVKFGDDQQQQAAGKESTTKPDLVAPEMLNVVDILSGSNLEDLEYSEEEGEEEEEAGDQAAFPNDAHESDMAVDLKKSDSLEHILVKDEEEEVKPEKEAVPNPAKQQWAFMIDVTQPVKDFHKRVPDMAHKWDFEPDTFQKQAILRLETHDSVFVAAHTSAGKTAVAEYAIALSHQHRTRTVYTSPIKALSNQKFRDFKKTLSVAHPGLDVGLLTGDVQIKPEASCLIMTTEILRSMLYNGSDVIRDVEWVIFDEVHYINDAERGVVWEEVLIMLPDHVGIILLSATVPNTLEFADWIGRTKKKQIYVISTAKRPVPLEHFLYTGNSNKTSNELFLLVDQHGKFLTRGYQAAVDAKKDRASKGKDAYGAKGSRANYNPKSDRNVWLSLITMLEKKDRLPVVAFTFSRRKCEENADALSNLTLTTSGERSRIQVQMNKYLSRLKGTDQALPQVTRMQELLKRGIGVHHSGILPILKEMIEILFQEGLVKLLYATETFAMGVNMPARTVVFDTIRKNDGSNFRDLLTGEYIQMAGRAGRRGKDLTGTVIILCKGDVQEASDLHKMMLGKPSTLSSQFRLTYSMMLNLLRVEQLRVQDMMKRSFAEFHLQKDAIDRRQQVLELERKLDTEPGLDCVLCNTDMRDYYMTCKEMRELSDRIKAAVFTSPNGQKALSPGRVVTVDTADHKNALAVILKSGTTPYQPLASTHSTPAAQSAIDKMFTVLVLCDPDRQGDQSSQDPKKTAPNQGELQPHVRKTLFQPEGRSAHRVIHVMGHEISDVTVRQIKIDGDKISDDYRKRMQPRFRDDPPGRSAITAEQELLRLTEANPEGLELMGPVKDFNIRDLDMVDVITRYQSLRDIMDTFSCTTCPTFYEHFCQVRDEMELRAELDHMKYLLSDQSLQLLPEYHQRLEVLRKLRYIDSSHRVELKGRVACEMSNHELMMTELVFQSAFTGLHHTEIVALLSCFVFQQKHCSEPDLTKTLSEGKERILAIAGAIAAVQTECGLNTPVDEYRGQFCFGLAEAVYEWARGMPFAEITSLTDVQEGVIVRCIQRLHETCLNVRNAARIIGDPTLYQKMEEASTAVKRDIVFAASLYTQ